jgi:mannose-1-phosphate guanylyltransferase/mannose-6-phosphate isomerase
MNFHGDTLFARAIARASAVRDALPPLVICNNEHRFLAAAILQEQGRIAGREYAAGAKILLEPIGRNTAPAIALAALTALEKDDGEGGDPCLLVLSADHVLSPQQVFVDAVTTAAAGADAGYLLVFGLAPSRAETSFGYIRQGLELAPGIFAVSRFVEKPDICAAEAMLEQGGVWWNSGIFLFRASIFLEELALHAPTVHDACVEIHRRRTRDCDFIRFPEEAFAGCPSISVDYALMEHTNKVAMTPLAADWNDMGSWEAFYAVSNKDGAGNACVGDVLQLDSRDCYLHAEHRLVAAVGLDNISVVETADAVLVLKRERSQDVKLLLEEMQRRGRTEISMHARVYRPWGSYEVLAVGDRFQVKRIIVSPGAVLSLQLHHHRAEHWVVVRGTAQVTVGDGDILLQEDQSMYIPLGTRHRLSNPGRIPLEIIEIQTGSYLGEDDIVRLEDNYGRIPGLLPGTQ